MRKRTAAERSRDTKRAWKREPWRRRQMSRLFRHLWQQPGYRRRQVDAARRLWSDPERRRRTSEALKRAWARSPARRRRTAQQMKQQWRNPSYRRQRVAGMKGRLRDITVRRRMSAAQQRVWRTPGYCQRMSRILRRAWRACSPRRRAQRIAIAKRSLGPSLGARSLHRLLGDGWVLEFWTPHGPLDVANPAHMVAIEVDGADHDRPKQQRRDRQKERGLRRLGWTILRVSEADCRGLRMKGVSK